ncbi:MAG: hypothetical protein V4631_14125 [Pseudomonadota bacterium]
MLKSCALFAACLALLGMGVPAHALEVLGAGDGIAPPRQDLAALPMRITLPVAHISELPEPEVFAMMLLGLVLIGYRVSRDSDEKFTSADYS